MHKKQRLGRRNEGKEIMQNQHVINRSVCFQNQLLKRGHSNTLFIGNVMKFVIIKSLNVFKWIRPDGFQGFVRICLRFYRIYVEFSLMPADVYKFI